MKTTLIIPTYNELENLPRLVPAILNQPVADLGILFVDDNSPDGTGELAEELAKAYPGRIQVAHRERKQGLGPAYLYGFERALKSGSGAVGQMDADFSHPPERLPDMVAMIEKYDVVIGSRYVKGGSVDENWPLWRRGLSAWGNFYARTILRLPLRDVTGGFRLWRRETLEGMPLEGVVSNGYVFQIELAYMAYKLGYRFGETPIYFADRKWGVSKMSLRIQMEAALRTWQVLYRYQALTPRVQTTR